MGIDSKYYRQFLDSLTDGIYFVDRRRTVRFWNKGAERITGYSAEEICGSSCADNFLRHVDRLGRELCQSGCPLAATMRDGGVREAEVYIHHKFGHRVPISVRATPIRDEDGEIVGALEVFRDCGTGDNGLCELEELRKEILTDPLTGIGNRRYAEITMECMEETMRDSGVPFGIVLADIDRFKAVNDRWGHHVGDRILKVVAANLVAALRKMDVACRWGGEEFVILIPNTSEKGVGIVAERARMLVEKSWIDHEGEMIRVTISLGGALSEPGESASSTAERADRQLYLSKESGRNRVHVEKASAC